VVRLKGGDPFIFGRGGEELQAAADPFQVVPGVTAAAGATAYAGIPLTHRDYAQSVTFVTGHYKPDSAPSTGRCWRKPTDAGDLHGHHESGGNQRQLIAHGRDSDTPVAVISRGTRDDQQTITGTQQLEHLAKDAPMPALLVVGEVVQLHQQLAWFQHTSPQMRLTLLWSIWLKERLWTKNDSLTCGNWRRKASILFARWPPNSLTR
jgi:uroporphyrin-III C-methyltransferase/precorrin-2 dehydrogenase/sirohydrochlorin ferrochelatase